MHNGSDPVNGGYWEDDDEPILTDADLAPLPPRPCTVPNCGRLLGDCPHAARWWEITVEQAKGLL
jgi:hypothetical protein